MRPSRRFRAGRLGPSIDLALRDALFSSARAKLHAARVREWSTISARPVRSACAGRRAMYDRATRRRTVGKTHTQAIVPLPSDGAARNGSPSRARTRSVGMLHRPPARPRGVEAIRRHGTLVRAKGAKESTAERTRGRTIASRATERIDWRNLCSSERGGYVHSGGER